MKVTRQREYECMLTTVAALAHKPLAQIRRVACRKAKIQRWIEITKDPYLFWEIIKYLANLYDIKAIPIYIDNSYVLISGGGVRRKSIQGRGSITILSPYNGVHIMPFENGLIHDSDIHTKPFPLNELQIKYPRWKILAILKDKQHAGH